jgi:hypothetical protein
VFNVADSTITKITNKMLNFFNQIAHRFIKFPRTQQEKQLVSEKFQRVSVTYNFLAIFIVLAPTENIKKIAPENFCRLLIPVKAGTDWPL